MDIFAEILEARHNNESLVMATVVDCRGSAPRKVGARMLVYDRNRISGTIGGGAIEKAVIDEAVAVRESGIPRLKRFELEKDLGMRCGGVMTIFLEPIVKRPGLMIFGAGHIGTVLAGFGHMLGFSVTIVDNRPEYAASERFPDAAAVIAAEYSRALPDLVIDRNTFIVIVTHQHAFDQEILEFCVERPCRYLGMIGSTSKVKKSFEILEQKGIAKEKIERIHSPIGIDIGGDTPEEIALSIAAEIVAIRNGREMSVRER